MKWVIASVLLVLSVPALAQTDCLGPPGSSTIKDAGVLCNPGYLTIDKLSPTLTCDVDGGGKLTNCHEGTKAEIYPPSKQYQEGYCAGWNKAVKAVWNNRNHNRALSGYAPETQAEAMKRIYTSWPAPPPPTLKGREDHIAGAPIKHTVDIMLDSIDLYVVLPDGIGCPIPQSAH